MNSDQYELSVADKIESGIIAGDHGLDPKACVIKRKPKYYSRDRMGEIIFDAAVEITRPRESTPYFFWVIECKHHSHNVPVDDAEEFFAKLQQIGGANLKGTIVTKTGFASGTVAYARSKGIGLWRYDPDGEIVYVVQADSLRDRAILAGLTECEFEPQFFGLATNGYLTVDIDDMIGCELWSIGQQLNDG